MDFISCPPIARSRRRRRSFLHVEIVSRANRALHPVGERQVRELFCHQTRALYQVLECQQRYRTGFRGKWFGLIWNFDTKTIQMFKYLQDIFRQEKLLVLQIKQNKTIPILDQTYFLDKTLLLEDCRFCNMPVHDGYTKL